MKELVDVHRRPRGSLDATVVLATHGGARLGPLRVENLSAGGALLIGGGALAVGTRVQVELRLPGGSSVQVAGTVVRAQAPDGEQSSSIAVAFREVAGDIEDLIQQAVLDALERVRCLAHPAVLVLDDSTDRRDALERDLAALGQRTLHAATPLDALRWLQDQHARVETVLVGLQFGRTCGLEVLSFLREHFPQVRRVLMSREAHAAELEHACTSGTAHATLLEPWDREQLVRTLGPRAKEA